MMATGNFYASLLAVGIAVLSASPTQLRAQENTVSIGNNDLGGVVTSATGVEAGVWVIAETTDLPTKMAKIVVSDDRGRYLIPDLPQANYNIWVRGYGLVDSAKVQSAPGKIVNLNAVVAPNPAAAAEYYPAIYWYSMLKVPDKGEFPGTGTNGNGMPETLKSQAQWLDIVKTNGCYTCHQLGNKATRTIPKEFGHFKTSIEAWERRIQSGQAMTQMTTNIGRLDTQRAFKLFADWTDRIAAGELPAAIPMRPQGVERNVVITLWDWAGPKDYLHDEISTDKRNPTVNANGLIFGATEESTDLFPVLDPIITRRHRSKCPCAIQRHRPRRITPWHPRPTGEMKSSGTARPACTILCSTRRDACGSPRGFVRRTIRPFAKRARNIHPRKCSRLSAPTASSPCTNRLPGKSP